MAFLTDRKRVEGLGSAKTGTEHHWSMTISSVALLILTPMFLFAVGPLLGEPHADAVAGLSRPYPALVTALMLIVGFHHFRMGVQTLIEDYVRGMTRKIAIIAMTIISYGLAATGLVALAQIAL
ncbi:succinate dehydrogenase, hydrophobic membrane anchor protein [Roseobacter sp. HKCCD9010]|uniref:succinate dehydrogenase, hydrophobic membrane anchor protein n=1 Tax=unclassified Roseobacter TaxID=196798 RepID=UPI00149177D1|nr:MULTISPECIES: succinate dehydrogenase, hydrophobic membrane anchor protein [unclassified Roseobacter]MBF9049008.1 succinate dehydrogenase, hydrophobic membrane anchor protein [Rhodobacterales bacterium HKCCD4356]NNV11008.1 succinate dehydrogenase, hydrophobic membrane anchor protein [Roseobacter sp. HKCCD7357]NNV15192.1 succinate dehydrogenase, hydrophobic membrane anchor protein [Roseobacter sp. HKCCD8768]NNV24652.1 succinate dehydrogenase, hydrophobic membrane anchor protein [Roseobacter s